MVRCYVMLDPGGKPSAVRMEARRRDKPLRVFLSQVAATLADLRAMGCTGIRRIGEKQWREWK